MQKKKKKSPGTELAVYVTLLPGERATTSASQLHVFPQLLLHTDILSKQLNMRPLTDEETKTMFEKLSK